MTQASTPSSQPDTADPLVVMRKAAQRIMANSLLADIEAVWHSAGLPLPQTADVTVLRGPEIGLMMVRARAGGDGQLFNLGEMTVTRCSLSLGGELVGHGYVAGRSGRHAEFCALSDALAQSEPETETLQTEVLAPLAETLEARQREEVEKAAATRVDFFTLVRGEDE
ncbi:MAG: phosphonate C-P lyase system protein PhnG [Pseudomonadota bacterium]